jgi:hypothetical protein
VLLRRRRNRIGRCRRTASSGIIGGCTTTAAATTTLVPIPRFHGSQGLLARTGWSAGTGWAATSGGELVKLRRPLTR